jgi:hypothetical protein
MIIIIIDARWPRGQSVWRAIAEVKQRSQRPVIGWVTKIYYLGLFRASEGTLSCWSRLHLQSFEPTPVSRRVYVRQAVSRKNDCRITYIYTFIPLTLYPRRGGRGISDIPPRHSRFTKTSKLCPHN